MHLFVRVLVELLTENSPAHVNNDCQLTNQAGYTQCKGEQVPVPPPQDLAGMSEL